MQMLNAQKLDEGHFHMCVDHKTVAPCGDKSCTLPSDVNRDCKQCGPPLKLEQLTPAQIWFAREARA